MGVRSISSLSQFLKWHKEQKLLALRYNGIEHENVKISFECFFRGSSNRDYKLTPSIYRKTSLLRDEDKIIASCTAQRPHDFRDDKSTFERLTRMQHFGIPTRLLDVTTTPLVALYFAVCPSKQEDVSRKKKDIGKLTVVFVAQRSIKFADSDTISAVANIANMPNWWSSLTTGNLYQQYLRTNAKDAEQQYLSEYSQSNFMQKLLQQVLREKPYFQPRIKKDDLERVWCVIPPMNNERICRQHGAFLLFGIAGKKRRCIDIIEKDSAELLLESINQLEQLANGNTPHGMPCSTKEKKEYNTTMRGQLSPIFQMGLLCGQ